MSRRSARRTRPLRRCTFWLTISTRSSRGPSRCGVCRKKRSTANRAARLACDHGSSARSTPRIAGKTHFALSKRGRLIRGNTAGGVDRTHRATVRVRLTKVSSLDLVGSLPRQRSPERFPFVVRLFRSSHVREPGYHQAGHFDWYECFALGVGPHCPPRQFAIVRVRPSEIGVTERLAAEDHSYRKGITRLTVKGTLQRNDFERQPKCTSRIAASAGTDTN